MNYEKIYHDICKRGKFREKNQDVYLEKHHITPAFFFKDNTRSLRHNDGIFEGTGEHVENVTFLTPREHFLAHILLCKIWSNTKWYHRCRSSLILFFGKENSNHPRGKNFNPGDSVKYAKYAQLSRDSLSELRKGTMPVKDAKTWEMIGSVAIDHPKVLSGEWIHHSKGKKLTDENVRQNYRNAAVGLKNSNSKYTDEELIDSYLECCKYFNQIISGSLWALYAKDNNKPFIKTIKPFRFNGNGFKDLMSIAGERIGYKVPTEPYHFFSYEYRKLVRNYKNGANN